MVADRLDRRPPEHRSRRALQKDMGSRVGHLNPEIVGQSDDPDADEIGEVGQIPETLIERKFRSRGASAETCRAVDECFVGMVHSAGLSVVGQLVRDGIERSAARERDGGSHADENRLQADESHDDPVHDQSMAQQDQRP